MAKKISYNPLKEVNKINNSVRRIVKRITINLDKSFDSNLKDNINFLTKFINLQITLIKFKQELMKDYTEDSAEDIDMHDKEMMQNYIAKYLNAKISKDGD